jgi:hypothetical protein
MLVEARISPVWKKQRLFVSLIFLAMGAWFCYDGAFTYPQSNVRRRAYDNFARENRLQDWPDFAHSKGWVTKPPEKIEDATTQFVYGGFTSAIGLLLLIYWLTQKKRVLRADDEAVYTTAGTRVPFEAIISVNKSKWDSKGIARVRYALTGRQGEFIVDDYKFDTAPTRLILERIDERLLARKMTEAA